MSAKAQPNYIKVRIGFALSYSDPMADPYTLQVAGEVADFGKFLVSGGAAVVKAFNPELTTVEYTADKTLAQLLDAQKWGKDLDVRGLGEDLRAVYPFIGAYEYDAPFPPPFQLDETLNYVKAEVDEAMSVLLKRVFYMPAIPPRIDSMGYFRYYAQYWNGDVWASPTDSGSGGGAKMRKS